MRMTHDSASEAISSLSNESSRVTGTAPSNRLAPSSANPEDPPRIQVATAADPVELASKALRLRATLPVLVTTVVVVASADWPSASIESLCLQYIEIPPFKNLSAVVLPAVSLQKAMLDPQSPHEHVLQYVQSLGDKCCTGFFGSSLLFFQWRLQAQSAQFAGFLSPQVVSVIKD
jgi:hypothetical protein